ncbi:hypothetical protein FRC17_009258 [Serendipita sp. 399]|nr:hypothetical protein FRC17_009258 [Serendipita sp. 399]
MNPTLLTSSPLRQLYEVLSVFEANRDWSVAARKALLDKVSARIPQAHQPDIFLLRSMLDDIGIAQSPQFPWDDFDPIPSISQLSRTTNATTNVTTPSRSSSLTTPQSAKPMTEGVTKPSPMLTPQIANAMTTKEMTAYVMLQMFGELSEQRIESWARVAKLIVTQPMDGFATPEWPQQ